MSEETAPSTKLRWTRADALFLTALVLLVLALRLWHLNHTVVTARDSIGYSRIAWRLGHHPISKWPDVFRNSQQHPGYPLTVWWTYQAIRDSVEGSEPWKVQLAAQLANSLASFLLVIPLYFLGREWGDRRLGFGAALLIQCFPVTGRLFADGLSEGLFLLLTSTSLFFAVRAIRQKSALGAFAGAGTFSALAYWVRPEGAVVVLATGLVLLVSQFIRNQQRDRKQFLLNGGALAVPALLIALPFVLSIGHVTVKPTGQTIIDGKLQHERVSGFTSTGPMLWAVWFEGDPDASRRFWAAKVLFLEINEAGFYVGGIPTLLAWWWWLQKRRRWPEPAAWILIVVSLVMAMLLWKVAADVGYLSSRHAVLILMCCVFSCASGLIQLTERLANQLKKPLESGSAWALGLTVLLAAVALPKTMKPLHENRTGFREAGEWIAKNAKPTDPVTDPYRWAHFYSGRVFQEESRPRPQATAPATEYVVVEIAGNPHRRLRHLPPVLARVEKHKEKSIAFSRFYSRGERDAEVRVYVLRP